MEFIAKKKKFRLNNTHAVASHTTLDNSTTFSIMSQAI